MGGQCAPTTIKKKLSALRTAHIDAGFDATHLVSSVIETTIRGIKRFHGERGEGRAIPITLPVLERILATLDQYPTIAGGRRNADNCATAFAMAFAGFLRMGEFTYTSFDRMFDLRRGSVDFVLSSVRLSASKTDPFRKGVAVTLPTMKRSSTNPLDRIRRLVRDYPKPPEAPLFDLGEGTPFARKDVEKVLQKALTRAGYDSEGYTGHSFRRGAATWASSLGFSDVDIMEMGRWSSTAWTRYVERDISQKILRVDGLFDTKKRSTAGIGNGIPRRSVHWAPNV